MTEEVKTTMDWLLEFARLEQFQTVQYQWVVHSAKLELDGLKTRR